MRTPRAIERLGRIYSSPRFAVLLLVGIGVVFRSIPLRLRYLLGYDPYFHLAYIRYAVENGVVDFFPYARGPWGVFIKQSHPLGFWMTPIVLYKLTGVLGLSLFNTFRITPVIFGTLTILCLYILVRLLYDEIAAFLVSLLLAISFGHIFRSMAGYYRGDNYILFWYVLYMLALWLLIDSRGNSKRKLIGAALVVVSLGFSSAFWAAYYVIFVWAILNIITISFWSFIKRDSGNLKVSMALLLLSLAAAITADLLGGVLGYGMLGFDRELGRRIATQLGIPLGVPIKDAFLSAYVIYVLPAVLGVQAMFYVIRDRIQDTSKRTGVVVFILLAGLLIAAMKFNVHGIVGGIFHSQPIREMERTQFSDWIRAYSLAGLTFPIFILRLRTRKPELRDVLVLETSIVLLSMTIVWSRFLFFGSLGIALLGGIGLAEAFRISLKLKKHRTVASAILVGLVVAVPLVTGATSLNEVLHLKPFMNPEWERALTYLGNHSNPNDVVMVWWDHGSWVTYYSKRAPVAEINPNRDVAQYYLGLLGRNYLEEMGVDYVIVSYDTLLQFPAVVATAGQNVSEYAMVILHPVIVAGNVVVFRNGPYSLTLSYSNESWSAVISIGGKSLEPSMLLIERGDHISSTKGMGKGVYVYVNLNYGYAVLMNENAFNTTFAKLMFTPNPGSEYHLVYSDGGYIKIYRFIHPNVEAGRRSGKLILKPAGPAGTLFVYVYSPSGRLLFKEEYHIHNGTVVELPRGIVGNDVVRYTYMANKMILDRGIFRAGDIH